MSFFRVQFLDYKDAVCCVCFKILIWAGLASYFFRFLPHFSKKLRSIPMIYFFEKEKNEKNEKMDDTGSHIVVAPDKKKKKLKTNFIFLVWRTQITKKIWFHIQTPLKKSIQKNENNLDFISYFCFFVLII